MDVTEKLAAWVAGTPRIGAARPTHLARQAMVDVVGCMLAGARDPATLAVLRAVGRWGAGPATLVGHSGTMAAPWAALVNGTAAHALDYDDNFLPSTTHATAVAAPALLALAEERHASGAALLDAYIVALEIQARVGQGVNMAHYRRGWHATSTIGAIGTAAGAARLLQLDAAGARNAISLAVSMAAGPKRQFGTLTKPVHAGLAAKAAVMAASLAAAGMEAHPEPLDGPWSFRDLFAGPQSPGYDTALASLGNPLAIEEFGLRPKIYPCCGSTHRSLDGLLALRAEHAITPDMVESVESVVPDTNFRNLMYSEPADGMEGRFSMNYCLALALVQGELSVADFQPGAVERPAIRAWLPRIAMRRHDRDPAALDRGAMDPAVVTVRLKDGRALTTSVDEPRGSLAAPLDDAAYERKFRDCAAGVIADDAAEATLQALWRLDEVSEIGDVTRCLRAPDERAAAAD